MIIKVLKKILSIIWKCQIHFVWKFSEHRILTPSRYTKKHKWKSSEKHPNFKRHHFLKRGVCGQYKEKCTHQNYCEKFLHQNTFAKKMLGLIGHFPCDVWHFFARKSPKKTLIFHDIGKKCGYNIRLTRKSQ